MAAAVESPLPRANSTWYAIDGALTIVAADDPVEIAVRRDRVAKRARDEQPDEVEARGWSSAIPDYITSLRRRRGTPPSSFYRGTTLVPVPVPIPSPSSHGTRVSVTVPNPSPSSNGTTVSVTVHNPSPNGQSTVVSEAEGKDVACSYTEYLYLAFL